MRPQASFDKKARLRLDELSRFAARGGGFEKQEIKIHESDYGVIDGYCCVAEIAHASFLSIFTLAIKPEVF